jgi:hypothetical protein
MCFILDMLKYNFYLTKQKYFWFRCTEFLIHFQLTVPILFFPLFLHSNFHIFQYGYFPLISIITLRKAMVENEKNKGNTMGVCETKKQNNFSQLLHSLSSFYLTFSLF